MCVQIHEYRNTWIMYYYTCIYLYKLCQLYIDIFVWSTRKNSTHTLTHTLTHTHTERYEYMYPYIRNFPKMQVWGGWGGVRARWCQWCLVRVWCSVVCHVILCVMWYSKCVVQSHYDSFVIGCMCMCVSRNFFFWYMCVHRIFFCTTP